MVSIEVLDLSMVMELLLKKDSLVLTIRQKDLYLQRMKTLVAEKMLLHHGMTRNSVVYMLEI
jgi:hypothetical protein